MGLIDIYNKDSEEELEEGEEIGKYSCMGSRVNTEKRKQN